MIKFIIYQLTFEFLTWYILYIAMESTKSKLLELEVIPTSHKYMDFFFFEKKGLVHAFLMIILADYI